MTRKSRKQISRIARIDNRSCKTAYIRYKLPLTISPVTSMTFASCLAGGPSYPKTHKEERKMAAKVSLGFGKLSDTELDNFAQSVIDSLTGTATYPTPPVTPANLQTAKDDFTDKISAAQGGGPAATAAKN